MQSAKADLVPWLPRINPPGAWPGNRKNRFFVDWVAT